MHTKEMNPQIEFLGCGHLAKGKLCDKCRDERLAESGQALQEAREYSEWISRLTPELANMRIY